MQMTTGVLSAVQAGSPRPVQQGRPEQHEQPVAATPPSPPQQPPLQQPARRPPTGAVPAMQALVIELYMRRHQNQQQHQGTQQYVHAGEPAPLPPHPAHAQHLPGPAQHAAVGPSSRGSPVAQEGPAGQYMPQQPAASSLDTAGTAAGNQCGKRPRTSLDPRRRAQQSEPLGSPASARMQHGGPAPQQAQQAQHAQQQRQQPPWARWPLPLEAAVQVSIGKWEAVSCVSAALAELDHSAPSAADRQEKLDGALFAAVHGSRCPPACVAVVRLLLEAGASATAVDSSGRPVLAAFLRGSPSGPQSECWSEQDTAALIETLVAAGASATAQDSQGLLPLERAVCMGSGAMVRGALRALAATGADLLHVDRRGKGGLHHAAAFSVGAEGLEAAIELLLEAGCDPLAPDADGMLPLQLLDSGAGRSTGAATKLLAKGMRARSAADREAHAALREQQDRQQCCVVCMQRPRTIALLPCGHFAFCDGCAAASMACPICRQAVASRHNVHLA